MGGWAVVQTLVRSEDRANHHVERQGFETFLPRMIEVSQVSGRRVERESKMFPGYLFVRVVDQWRCLLGTIGVCDVIRFGEGPALLRDEVVAELRERADRDGLVRVAPPAARFAVGQRVRVVEGPFTGLMGCVELNLAHDRVRVMLDMFRRAVRVEVETTVLAA
jgi:transcriptional antiterminator RfaH